MYACKQFIDNEPLSINFELCFSYEIMRVRRRWRLTFEWMLLWLRGSDNCLPLRSRYCHVTRYPGSIHICGPDRQQALRDRLATSPAGKHVIGRAGKLRLSAHRVTLRFPPPVAARTDARDTPARDGPATTDPDRDALRRTPSWHKRERARSPDPRTSRSFPRSRGAARPVPVA